LFPLRKYCKNRNVATFMRLSRRRVKENYPTGTGASRRNNENMGGRIKGLRENG